VREADVVLFVVDASVGLTDDDQTIANWIRRSGTQVIVVANKADNERRETEMWEFMSLGIGEPIPVSALHGRRAGDLLDAVLERFPDHLRTPASKAIDPWAPDADDDRTDEVSVPRVAIVGRPNVGKSTLFNRLVGEDRAVVHDLAGTTRDSIDTLVDTDGGPIVFIDTAGMRRKGKIDDAAEYYSFVRALRSIDDADVALLVIDATVGVTAQDQRLAERVDSAGCPIVLILNKWDLVGTEERLQVQAEVKRMLAFVADSSVLKISALSGKNVEKLHPRLHEAISQYHTRVPTKDVNKVIAAAQQRQPAGGGAKIMYAVQGAIDPPTFTLFVNREIPQHYLRYIERTIREEFGLGSTALKLRVRKRQ
jgi:GTP-binding protein